MMSKNSIAPRFTEPVRQVVEAATECAIDFRHGEVGTEHLLLGILLQANSPNQEVLEESGVTLERVRRRLIKMIGRGEATPGDDLALTPNRRASAQRTAQP